MKSTHHKRDWRAGVATWFVRFCLASAVGWPVAVGATNWPFPPGSVRQEIVRDAPVFGMPLTVVLFEAPLDLPATVAYMAQHWPGHTPMVRVTPDEVSLSGVAEGAQRLISLLPGQGERTRGMASLWQWPQADAGPPARQVSTEVETLRQAGGQLLFDMGSQEMAQQVYRHDLPPGAAMAHLAGLLEGRGWQVEEGMSDSLGRWRRGETGLAVLMVPFETGSGWMVHWIRRPS